MLERRRSPLKHTSLAKRFSKDASLKTCAFCTVLNNGFEKVKCLCEEFTLIKTTYSKSPDVKDSKKQIRLENCPCSIIAAKFKLDTCINDKFLLEKGTYKNFLQEWIKLKHSSSSSSQTSSIHLRISPISFQVSLFWACRFQVKPTS